MLCQSGLQDDSRLTAKTKYPVHLSEPLTLSTSDLTEAVTPDTIEGYTLEQLEREKAFAVAAEDYALVRNEPYFEPID